MPDQPRNNFPIGAHDYIDYLNAGVNNQLNIFNIPYSRHRSSDDSDPGSPASSHGEDRTAQSAYTPASYTTNSPPFATNPLQAPAQYHTQYVATQDDTRPYAPTYADELHATGNSSAIRSTTSPFTRQHSGSPESLEYRNPVRAQSFYFIVFCLIDPLREAQLGLYTVTGARR